MSRKKSGKIKPRESYTEERATFTNGPPRGNRAGENPGRFGCLLDPMGQFLRRKMVPREHVSLVQSSKYVWSFIAKIVSYH